MLQPGQLFVVAAPSGAGKTSLCKALIARLKAETERELFWSVSYTTRSPREGEEHGRDYFFVDDAAFDRMTADGRFAEWANVHGRRYGTDREYLAAAADRGQDLLVEIDIQGARQLRHQYNQAHFIFILPPSWPVLETRLRGRGTESEAEIQRRLARAHDEMREWTWFDYVIINDRFELALDYLRAVVLAARCRKDIMANGVQPILASGTEC
jgi:guanylate kinase